MSAIEINNLTKYYGKARGIIDVSMNISEGEIFGFIGPNGAGKSTTIRTIMNYIHPTSGSARIFGLDCFKDSEKIKYNIGYLPSEVNYYDDMRVKDLLLYSAKFYEKDCTERINELCSVFDLDTNKKIIALSYGNRKKTAVVQALLHEPKLLILDEPTGGLDPLMQNNFFEILREENKKGVTIFFSSHILSEVQKMCDRVAIIKEGRILKIEQIERLRAAKYKKVKVELKSTEMAEAVTFQGMTNITRKNHVIDFLYNGKIDDMIKGLSVFEVENLWIEEPQLEEIFMHYYE